MIIKINDNIELIEFLKKKLKFNKQKTKKLVIDRGIFINNKLCNSIKYPLKPNDIVEIKCSNEFNDHEIHYQRLFDMIDIIYEDEYLLVINKPSGLLVHNDKFSNEGTLEQWIKNQYKLNNIERSGIVHRLDKDTSGLMIIAKTIECYDQLKNQFNDKNITRKYKAIVLNNFNLNDYIMINKPIGHKNDKHLKMTTSHPKNPKESITVLKALEKIGKNHFLVECELKTGRTHQIRVHMNYINHPILNDPLYGVPLNNDNYNQYLYAYYLSFMHPITFIKKEFILELPIQFINKIKELNNE